MLMIKMLHVQTVKHSRCAWQNCLWFAHYICTHRQYVLLQKVMLHPTVALRNLAMSIDQAIPGFLTKHPD